MSRRSVFFAAGLSVAALPLLIACGARAPSTSVPNANLVAPPPSASAAASANTSDAGPGQLVNVPAETPDDTALARYRAIVAAPDRSAGDRALDAGRHPAELLAFAAINDGMHVAELGAWKGYTAELLARAVGDSGHVFAQDPASFDSDTKDAWTRRMKNPLVAARITRVARDFEDPLPPEAHDLDAVLMVLFYHDTVWLNVDRPKMNKAIFAALKSGGEYIVVDHSAMLGQGTSFAQKLHRIEESAVRHEIEQAGFVLAGTAEFLRNPGDTRDWSSAEDANPQKRGTSDRFVLKYVKP